MPFLQLRHLHGPYLPAGRCRGDTRVFPERLRVITGRVSKEGVGSLAVVRNVFVSSGVGLCGFLVRACLSPTLDPP